MIATHDGAKPFLQLLLAVIVAAAKPYAHTQLAREGGQCGTPLIHCGCKPSCTAARMLVVANERRTQFVKGAKAPPYAPFIDYTCAPRWRGCHGKHRDAHGVHAATFKRVVFRRLHLNLNR